MISVSSSTQDPSTFHEKDLEDGEKQSEMNLGQDLRSTKVNQ